MTAPDDPLPEHHVPEAPDAPGERPPDGAGAPAPEPAPPAADELARLRARAAEADALEDRLKRAQAEFVNESRRIARQAEQDRRYAIDGLVKDLVPLAEGLEGALGAAAAAPGAGAPGAAPDLAALRAGVELVGRQLEDVLGRYGVEILRPRGQPFDPLAHEALLVVERADLPPGQVAEVVRPGFRLHGRVVRPAQVTVARAPSAPPAAGAAPSAPAGSP